MNYIVDKLKKNLWADVAVGVLAVSLIVTFFTYAAAIAGTRAYFALVTVFTVIALVVALGSLLIGLKGFAPLIALLFVGLAFGFFLASRMEDFGLLQVGIGTFGSMGAYVTTIVFYGIALVSGVAAAFLMKKDA